jgi:hypothetical protein
MTPYVKSRIVTNYLCRILTYLLADDMLILSPIDVEYRKLHFSFVQAIIGNKQGEARGTAWKRMA